MLGKAYLRMKDYKALTSVFARIMQVNPNSASAHIMMATAYDEADNRPEAIKEYQAAERADPSFAGVHSGLGYLYWREGDFQLAEKEFREELKRFPNDPVSNCVLGDILLDNVQLGEAEARFRLALKVNPAYADALLGLGKTEIALKRPREAVDVLRKAIQLQPDSGKAHYVLSTALGQLGQTAEAARERKIAADLLEEKRQEKIKNNQSQ
jgi:tetratricopeptide (TPR) repeat protein